ncbi:MAG: DUF4434 domain-containing protein [Candidatus Sumerlaeia bacterium]|nr:DUF4434 domain-containing protein [Candidatus Sumerlaeia bacterium]
MKPITGTFIDEITMDIPSQNWGRKEWERDFSTMAEVGIDTVIIIRSSYRDMAIFPSEALGIRDVPDMALLFLDLAHKYGMKLHFPSHDSGNLDQKWTNWEADWKICKRFLPEIIARYGDHPAFHGWYIAPENCHHTPGIAEIYKRYSDLMKDLAPEKPVLISPWYPSDVYEEFPASERMERFGDDWNRLLANAPAIDICAFQDGSCTCRPERQPATYDLESYIKTAGQFCRDAGVTLWNNAETFERRHPIKFPPLDWRWLRRKMAITDPYVEKHITFEFSHFLSPNSQLPAARLLFERYREFLDHPDQGDIL